MRGDVRRRWQHSVYLLEPTAWIAWREELRAHIFTWKAGELISCSCSSSTSRESTTAISGFGHFLPV
eukprot:SAG11_NODE_21378_length_426_cov_1.048930_1_plen_66_part_10